MNNFYNGKKNTFQPIYLYNFFELKILFAKTNNNDCKLTKETNDYFINLFVKNILKLLVNRKKRMKRGATKLLYRTTAPAKGTV